MKAVFLFALAALIVALALAHPDTEQDELIARDTRDAVKKIGRRQRKKKLFRKTKRNNHRRKDNRRRGSKKRQQRPKLNNVKSVPTCVSKLQSFDIALVEANKRKIIKIEFNKNLTIKKEAKKNDTIPYYNILLKSLGGDPTNPTCNGQSANETVKNLLKDLQNCPKAVEKACGVSGNITVPAKCNKINNDFDADYNTCRGKTTADGFCDCVDDLSFSEVQKCKKTINDDFRLSNDLRKPCVAAVSQCKKASLAVAAIVEECCSDGPITTTLPPIFEDCVVLVGTDPVDVELNKTLGHTFADWGKEFEMTVEVFINNFPTVKPSQWNNYTQLQPFGALFQFSNNSQADCCSPGTRVPALYTAHSNGSAGSCQNCLEIGMNGISDPGNPEFNDDNAVFKFGPVPTKQWFKLCISQYQDPLDTKYYLNVKVDGVQQPGFPLVNDAAEAFTDVVPYAAFDFTGDEIQPAPNGWIEIANATLRNFKVMPTTTGIGC